jgi:hypothetical protein
VEALDVDIESPDQRLTARLDRIAANIEANAIRLAVFFEGLERLERLVARSEYGAEDKLGQIESLIREQAETARIQTQRVNRLVETLTQRN